MGKGPRFVRIISHFASRDIPRPLQMLERTTVVLTCSPSSLSVVRIFFILSLMFCVRDGIFAMGGSVDCILAPFCR